MSLRIRSLLLPAIAAAGLGLMSGAALAAAAAQAPFSPGGFSNGGAPQAQGANAMSIAAVVNEDIITVFDVQARLGLYMATSGLENTAEIRQRLMPQVVNALIDDRLKLQEARRLKLVTNEAEIRQSVDGIEQRNGMRPGAFRTMLGDAGVDTSTLYTQIEADLAWVKVVRKELARDTTVQPQEVKAVMARMKANQGKPERLLAEIFLPVAPGVPEQSVRQLAERLVQQARSGTPFPALAQQFSQSATAALGGDLGWVVQGELEPELEAVVGRLEANQYSDPIRTSSGYHILALRERRSSGAPDAKMSVVTLSQIYLPNLGGRALPPQKLAQLSEDIHGHAKTCVDMNKLAKDFGGPGSGPISAVYLGGLPEKVRDGIMELKPNQVSQPIEVGGARLFVMICNRKDDTGLPSEEQIMSNLQNDKLTNAARQKLRDLRRAALIDIRI
jgi:peptidyl-prolyl cis-trans isomerase SurA